MTRLLTLLLSLLILIPLKAQSRDDYDNFIRASGDESILYRGREAARYNFIYNGTPYWYHYGFQKGEITYNGKLYRDVMLNVDAYSGEVAVRHPNGVVIISLNTRYIDDFSCGERLFRVLHDDMYGLDKGIYEVVYDGKDKVLKKIVKLYVPMEVHLTNGPMIGYEDPYFKNGVYCYFSPKVSYYHIKDGDASRFKGIRQLIRRYPASRKQARKVVSRLGIEPRDDMELCIRSAMEYIEEAGR